MTFFVQLALQIKIFRKSNVEFPHKKCLITKKSKIGQTAFLIFAPYLCYRSKKDTVMVENL